MNVVYPLGPTRTRVSFLYFVLDGSKRHEGVGADLHRVEMEDEDIVASAQRGVRSRLYERGRYSPRREVGTHHFHALLASFMRGSTAPVRLTSLGTSERGEEDPVPAQTSRVSPS